MSTPTIKPRPSDIQEVSRFITEHLADAPRDWPRRLDLEQAPLPSEASASSKSRPKTLVHGSLVINLCFELNASLADLVATLTAGSEKFRCDGWRYRGASVGGFAAHAIETVTALGGLADLCTTLPAPVPTLFVQFLRRYRVGTRHIVAVPGVAPAAIHLQCQGGHLLVARSGVCGFAPAPLPRHAFRDYDLVLSNPGARPGRTTILRALREGHSGAVPRATVALSARGDWDWEDTALVQGSGAWVVFNGPEIVEVARRTGLVREDWDAAAAVKHFKALVGCAKLVATLGAEGAYLLNGDAEVLHVRTRPVPEGQAVGAGDTLLAVTALSSAAGATDSVSVRRGVTAATLRVAGLPLPQELEGLDG